MEDRHPRDVVQRPDYESGWAFYLDTDWRIQTVGHPTAISLLQEIAYYGLNMKHYQVRPFENSPCIISNQALRNARVIYCRAMTR